MFFTAGGNLILRDSNINGKPYTLVTEHSEGGGRRITELGGATAPPEQPADEAPTLEPVDDTPYDINGDGTVNSKDVDALILAVSSRRTDAKYDVNGDGTVDVADIKAVNANLDFDDRTPTPETEVLIPEGSVSRCIG